MSHHNSRRPPPTYSQSQQHYPQGRLPPINRAAPPTGQTADYTSVLYTLWVYYYMNSQCIVCIVCSLGILLYE